MKTAFPRLLNESRMAARLGVKASWVRAEAEAGRLPHVPAGDRLLFDPETVEQVLLGRAQQPAPAAPDTEVGR